jgi:hypothetical protein
MSYTSETIEHLTGMTEAEYNKTWYYKLTIANTMSPKNWISCTPWRMFGKTMFVVWKVARPNYPWADNRKV